MDTTVTAIGVAVVAALEGAGYVHSRINRFPKPIKCQGKFESDRQGASIDTESGIELPAISVSPPSPEGWRSPPLADWLVGQPCPYKHRGNKNQQRVQLDAARIASRC